MAIATTNPATGETLRSFDPHDEQEVQRRIAAAHASVRELGRTSFAQRAAWMRATADLLESEASEIATTMTTEMGKTHASAVGEAQKCAMAMRFHAQHAESYLADEPRDAETVGAKQAYVRFQPLGVVLAVMPWNFPLWQVVRFAAPALMAGNTGLLKHASNVPQTALYLDTIFARGGFPDGAFQTLLVGSGAIEGVLRDPRVKAATLTGSEPAGRSVAAIAGSEVKHTVLELGGSDPFVVAASADVQAAAATAVTARCQNNGQSCIAAKRFIVHTDVYDEFADAFVAKMNELTVGDPMIEGTDVGPVANEQGRDELAAQVQDAIDNGATVLTGGTVPDGPGFFYPPTVIADITPQMRLYAEETFGPVAALYRVGSLDEAVELANATDFGLSSNAWATDPDEQRQLIDELDAGGVFLNGMTASHPELPFGGVKNSGYGRELSREGIREFCNVKTVSVK